MPLKEACYLHQLLLGMSPLCTCIGIDQGIDLKGQHLSTRRANLGLLEYIRILRAKLSWSSMCCFRLWLVDSSHQTQNYRSLCDDRSQIALPASFWEFKIWQIIWDRSNNANNNLHFISYFFTVSINLINLAKLLITLADWWLHWHFLRIEHVKH